MNVDILMMIKNANFQLNIKDLFVKAQH